MALAPHKKLNKTAQRIYEQYKKDKGEYFYFNFPRKDSAVETSDIVLCASGSLAMLYFINFPQRLYLEEVNSLHPNLIESLICHPGIGFLALDSYMNGPIVMNDEGIYYLNSRHFEGKNPLEIYENNAATQLEKLFSYTNVGDIVIQSKYEPETDRISAFENLLGHHGGIGGDQTLAFVMHPSSLPFTNPIVDSTQMHHQLRDWQNILFSSFINNEISDG